MLYKGEFREEFELFIPKFESGFLIFSLEYEHLIGYSGSLSGNLRNESYRCVFLLSYPFISANMVNEKLILFGVSQQIVLLNSESNF